MKKIFVTLGTLLIGSIMWAQTQLDTVFLRNRQMKGEEWWWCIKGLNPDNLDSVQSKWYNKLQKALRDANLNSSTQFTYDSLPGPFAMVFIVDYWRHPEARENMGQGIDNQMRGYAPFAVYLVSIDAARLARFTNRKTGGKNRTN